MSFKFGAFSGSSSGGGANGGGGGLYAGISLGGSNSAKQTTDEAPEKAVSDSAKPAATVSNPSETSPNETQDVTSTDANTSKDDTKKDEEKSKASSWSSSLRFAPVIRKQPAKSVTKPFAVPFSATTSVSTKSGLASTVFSPEDDHEMAPSNPTSRTMHIPGRAKAALNAPARTTRTSKAPSVFARKGGFLAAHAPERIPGSSNASGPSAGTLNPSSSIEKVDSSIPGFKHSLPAMLAETTTLKGLVPSNNSGTSNKQLKKKLEQPPPLTLPDDEFGTGGGDVNGFAQSEAGRKLALKAARNSKKSKKKGKSREVDPAILFMEDYDPARPNDYNEWMNFVKRRREERREALRLERQRQQRQEREEMSESSYYSSDDDCSGSDDARPAPRSNFFAPPPEYNAPSVKDNTDQGSSSAAPVPSIARAETGDEAYARRVALSQGKPYHPPQHFAGSAEATIAESALLVEPPSSSAAPLVSVADAQARVKMIAERLQRLKDSNVEGSDGPPPHGTDAPESSSFEPPPPTSNPPPILLEAQAKAKLIAAKLAALNGVKSSAPNNAPQTLQQCDQEPAPSGAPTEVSNKAPGQPDFARRLMDKYGWKEGQGLGANESGRTSILTVSAATAGPGGNKKRKDNPGDPDMAGPAGSHKIGSMAKGRGVVIDEAKKQRDLEEKMRYGEPTRIVYLTNVVAVDEVDDELATEIAEEARKHGMVERCFVRIIQRSDVEDTSERVRVFIIYSGLVGAWKAVKTFDGRFFGGRNIRARFFSENSFTLGDWDA